MKFIEAGSDGDRVSTANVWKKGIVFTRWVSPAGIEAGHRISVGFKRGVSLARPLRGFHDIYNRVFAIGTRRIAELAATNQDLACTASIACHGWQLLAEGGRPVSLDEGGKAAAAFVNLSVRKIANENVSDGECRPTFEDLRNPGGSRLEDLLHAESQHPAELYNEFDFSNCEDDLIVVSFGEAIIPADGTIDFGPHIENAETFTRWYYDTLTSLGEVQTTFRVIRREWFLADSRLVTVHVFFRR